MTSVQSLRRMGRFLAATVLGAALAACGDRSHDAASPSTPPAPVEAAASLAQHSEELRREVVRVNDNVHVAIGFALGNSILVTGENCAFVVDTTESRETGAAAMAAFRQITDLPIEALIYTHNHADHIFGAEAFAAETLAAGGRVEIYAHALTEREVDRSINILRPVLSTRSARMFGAYLTPDDNGFINAGLGPRLAITGPEGGSIGYLRPTRTFEDVLQTQICGVDVELRHAPGETDDQILVWLPQSRTILPADNIYRAFPNLYTIRGTSYRDVAVWARTTDLIRSYNAAYMVPSHTRPLAGAAIIAETLTAYGDAIRFVHDQTVRGMNMGLSPDELVQFVKLPPHLINHPYLLEHYGTVAWSVRSIYAGYLGWFDGDGANLFRAPPEERARAYAGLAADATTLTAAAEAALAAGDLSMAAEFATLALSADPADRAAAEVKASAFRGLAARSLSPNGRNYLMTQAGEIDGSLSLNEGAVDARSLSFVRQMPVANFMAALAVNLDAKAAETVAEVAEFHFRDTGQRFRVEVRRGVAIVTEEPAPQADLKIETTTEGWIDLLLKRKAAPQALLDGTLRFPDGLADLPRFGSFMKLFS